MGCLLLKLPGPRIHIPGQMLSKQDSWKCYNLTQTKIIKSIMFVSAERMYFKLLPAESPIAFILRRKQFSTIPKNHWTKSKPLLTILIGSQTEALSSSHLKVLSLPLNSFFCSFFQTVSQVSMFQKRKLKSMVWTSTKRLAHFSTTLQLG